MSLFAETITKGERDCAELVFRTGLICCLRPVRLAGLQGPGVPAAELPETAVQTRAGQAGAGVIADHERVQAGRAGRAPDMSPLVYAH